jgi:Na+/proline symporter
MTQRILTCKNANEGAKAMIWSVVLVIPVMALFIFIGLLLYVFYQRPDLMQFSTTSNVVQNFEGEKITIFMYYILNEIPAGVRGLVTVGVIAAALSTLNSGLNSMSSVLVQDLYRPYVRKLNKKYEEKHFVKAGQFGMILSALFLGIMAILCFYWQRYTQMPLLAFALSVMVFSYSGLLGVYFTALFTNRGNKRSVLVSLLMGAIITFCMQPYVLKSINPALADINIGFTWQLCIGTFCAFVICCLGKKKLSYRGNMEKAVNT